MGDIRYTAKYNEEKKTVEVLKVTDGPDGRPASTEVESTWKNSPAANNHIRELNLEMMKEGSGHTLMENAVNEAAAQSDKDAKKSSSKSASASK